MSHLGSTEQRDFTFKTVNSLTIMSWEQRWYDYDDCDDWDDLDDWDDWDDWDDCDDWDD